jgi:vacuolar-type H+-ATPase subunit E/Vma4
MALADLLTALEDEARREIADVEQQARAQADAVLAEAAARAEAVRRRAVEQHERVAAAEASGVVAAARGSAAAALRVARDPELAAVRAAPERALAEDRDPGRLAALLDEAARALPGFTAVHVAPADQDRVRALLAARGRDTAAVVGDLDGTGVVLVDERTRRHVDNRLSTRLDNRWPRLRVRLAAGWQEPDRAGGPAGPGGQRP